MPRPTFEDLHPSFNGSTQFRCTNEEMVLHERLLDDAKFEVAGGISGAGEVPIAVLLPRSKKVFAVDHNYGSLAVAYLKALLLDSLGGRGFKALILEQTHTDLAAACRKVQAEMPEILRVQVVWEGDYPTLSSGCYQEIRREWAMIPDTVVERARRNLANLTLAHGDLRDLRRFWPLECLYVSNAVGEYHTDRYSKVPSLADMAPLVREGGKMLIARPVCRNSLPGEDYWQHQKRIKATRLQWDYDIYKRNGTVAGSALTVRDGARIEVV